MDAIAQVKTAICPRCHQSIDAQAVACPYCRTSLKAFGHPGIPLHRAVDSKFLCDSCTYHADDTCNFPQRPYALECTLYQDVNQSYSAQQKPYTGSIAANIKSWIRRHQGLLMLLVLLFICFLIALRF